MWKNEKKAGKNSKKKIGFLRSKPSKRKMTFFSGFDLKNPRIFFFEFMPAFFPFFHTVGYYLSSVCGGLRSLQCGFYSLIVDSVYSKCLFSKCIFVRCVYMRECGFTIYLAIKFDNLPILIIYQYADSAFASRLVLIFDKNVGKSER